MGTMNRSAGDVTLEELPDDAVHSFTSGFHGDVLRPSDAAYDDARRIWNGMIDRYPALIARCAGVDDVVAAVTFAREHDLALAVRGGGHNVAGTAVCDGGVVIDLSGMNDVRVDPGGRGRRRRSGDIQTPFSCLASESD